MSELYLKWMDRLYLLAMAVAGISLLVMTIVIPIGIFSRYVLNRGESWPEPVAIICMVTFTFIGAAVSYRAGFAHCGEYAHRPAARAVKIRLRTGR